MDIQRAGKMLFLVLSDKQSLIYIRRLTKKIVFFKQIRKKQKPISFVLIGACFFLRVSKALNKEKWLKKIWEVSGLEGGGRKLFAKACAWLPTKPERP